MTRSVLLGAMQTSAMGSRMMGWLRKRRGGMILASAGNLTVARLWRLRNIIHRSISRDRWM